MNNFDLKKFLVENKLTSNSVLKEEPVKTPEDSSIETTDGEQIAPYEGKRDYDVEFSNWELHRHLESYGELEIEANGGYISSGTVSLTFEELQLAIDHDAYLESDEDGNISIRA